MTFLYLDKVTNRVLCSPEAMTRPEVQKVYNADKSKDKKNFNAVITALYWIFKPRNIYWNKSLSDRIKIVNDDYLREFQSSWEQLLKEPGVKDFMNIFIDLSTTINDRADQNLRNDFEALMEALNDVPLKIEIEIEAGADVLCTDGDIHRVKKTVKLSIPTFEQKSELWKQYETFSKILKTVQATLKIEDEERARASVDVYPYDGPEKKKYIKAEES